MQDLTAPYIKVAFTDLDGVLRGKYMPLNKLETASHVGMGFCNVVFGWDIQDEVYPFESVSGWNTGFPDGQLTIDPSSKREMPWEDGMPLYLGDFRVDEDLGEICPRNLLRTIIKECDDLGFQAKFGAEFEWFLFQETPDSLHEKKFTDLHPLSPGMFGYSMLRTGQFKTFNHKLLADSKSTGLVLEGLHTETGPGVYEAAIHYDQVLRAADHAVLFKLLVKQVAYAMDGLASFMAKWSLDYPGCSGHLHHSLWHEDNTPVFGYTSDGTHVNTITEQFIAGQLMCLPYIMPLLAPNSNSYRRYVEGSWAPTTVSWGKDNRTTAIRVVLEPKGGLHLEHRVPGSDANPYLSMAACLASGLYGIKHQLTLSDTYSAGNAYANEQLQKLPNTLSKAVDKMKQSPIPNELFGDRFIEHFIKTREWEVETSDKKDLSWERSRFLEII